MPLGLKIEKGENLTMWKADKRLYLNADKTAVVAEGSLAAASLLTVVGQEVPEATCKQYGLGPYANAQDATMGDTGAAEAETTTDTEPDTEGPQNGSQDAENTPDPDGHLTDPDPPKATTKPRRRR